MSQKSADPAHPPPTMSTRTSTQSITICETMTINNEKNSGETSYSDGEQQQEDHRGLFWLRVKYELVKGWILRQMGCSNNRYAFQLSVGFTIAAMLVVVHPISDIAPNPFWVGISVVTVLDNTVGGLLSLSFQRFIGTVIAAVLSIAVMTTTRALFPVWDKNATILLCTLMFLQVFVIAKIKTKPDMNIAGGIGLLTTVIIHLSGFQDLTHDKISGSAELGFWRLLELFIGIFIAILVSLCIFPVKARHTMRKNLGDVLEEAALLYERTAMYCLDLTQNESANLSESIKLGIERQTTDDSSSVSPPPPPSTPQTEPPCSPAITINVHPQKAHTAISLDMEIWNHELVDELCEKAFSILTRLETEATRMQSVSKEYFLQAPFRLLFKGGRERCREDLKRIKQYNKSIEATKSMVWPLVSFRLLLPVIKLNDEKLHERTTPTRATLQSFEDSLWVMRRLGAMLKDTKSKLRKAPDWPVIQWRVVNGNIHIQRELLQIIDASKDSDSIDGLKLLSYYGFLVRCATIWKGLECIVEELGTYRKETISTATSYESFPSSSGLHP